MKNNFVTKSRMTRKVWSKWPCKMDINSRAYCKTHQSPCCRMWNFNQEKGHRLYPENVSLFHEIVSKMYSGFLNKYLVIWKPGHIFGKQGHNFEKIGIHSPDTGIHFREIVCYRVGYLLIQFFTEVEKKLTRRKIRPARKVARETHSINIVSLW